MDPEEAGVESSSVSKGKNALCMTGWGQGTGNWQDAPAVGFSPDDGRAGNAEEATLEGKGWCQVGIYCIRSGFLKILLYIFFSSQGLSEPRLPLSMYRSWNPGLHTC